MKNTIKWLSENCKYSSKWPVLDYPPMQPHDINKTISYLSSNTFLPHDIKDWKEDKLRDYLSKTEKKKDYFEKWIIKHHEKLRDPKYRRQQEALYKLHSRLKTKVELIETIISKDSAHA